MNNCVQCQHLSSFPYGCEEPRRISIADRIRVGVQVLVNRSWVIIVSFKSIGRNESSIHRIQIPRPDVVQSHVPIKLLSNIQVLVWSAARRRNEIPKCVVRIGVSN